MVIQTRPDKLVFKPESMLPDHRDDVLIELQKLHNEGVIRMELHPAGWYVSGSDGVLYRIILKFSRTYDIEVV